MIKLETKGKSVQHWDYIRRGQGGPKTAQENAKKRNTASKFTEIPNVLDAGTILVVRHNFIYFDSKRTPMFVASTRQATQMMYKTCFPSCFVKIDHDASF